MQSSSAQIEVTANGLTFASLADGPVDGPLAVCLHGFSNSAHTWRYLLPDLAAAGFRAVAPWMRGYAPTSVPADGSYGAVALTADACALHEALGDDGRAVPIGHDWGAIAAYGAANFAPERWARVVTLAIPPLGAIGTKLFAYEQLRRSFYMYVFQTPMAEVAVGLDDMAFIDGLWRDWSPGYNASEDIAAAKDTLRAPANLGAAIGYYRAMLGATSPRSRVFRGGRGGVGRRATANAVPPRRPGRINDGRDVCGRGCVSVARFEDRDRGRQGTLSPRREAGCRQPADRRLGHCAAIVVEASLLRNDRPSRAHTHVACSAPCAPLSSSTSSNGLIRWKDFRDDRSRSPNSPARRPRPDQ
ncbi:MAG: alpha/beta fold hydrolase [Acidimicrobiales bacterium]